MVNEKNTYISGHKNKMRSLFKLFKLNSAIHHNTAVEPALLLCRNACDMNSINQVLI